MRGMPVRVSLPLRTRAGACDGEMPMGAEAASSDQGRDRPVVPPPQCSRQEGWQTGEANEEGGQGGDPGESSHRRGKQQLLAALERDFATKAGAVVNSAQENTW